MRPKGPGAFGQKLNGCIRGGLVAAFWNLHLSFGVVENVM